jgi:glucose 1-dehydrogenase
VSGLEGKVALVTGAAAKRSMGRAIAAQLGKDGAHVVVADREAVPKSIWPGDEDWTGLAAVVGDIEGWGGRGLAVTADVSVAADVDAMVARTVEEFGKLDILVHCVGVRGPVPVHVVDLDEATWRMLLDVNLTGAFLTAKASAKAMLADPAGTAGKKIILVSSMAGVSPYVGGAGYCASKHGVLGLMKTLARELAPYKINVNAINPGAFETNFRDDSLLKQAKDRGLTVEESLKNPPAGPTGQAGPPPIPLGRLGTPSDIADLVSFLVSDGASYITGEDINLSGGAS